MARKKLKFGMLLIPSNPATGSGNFSDRMDECIRHAQLAEKAGFDFAMVPEHHQDRGFLPQSLLPTAAILANTERLRVGTAIAISALKHPMTVVEEFFTLDHMSRGRVIAGIGVGYQPQDFSMFGLDVKDRVTLTEDVLQALDLAKNNDVIESFRGHHYDFDNVKIIPGPYQDDLPVLLGSWSHTGAKLAGRNCDGLFIDQNHYLDQAYRAQGLVESFTKAAEEAGRARTKPKLILNRYAGIGDTREEARAVLEPHVMKTKRYYWRNKARDYAHNWNKVESPDELQFEDFQESFLWGTPEDCIEQLEKWQEAIDMEEVLLLMRTASGPTNDVVEDQMMRFGRDVIPAFS